MNKLAFTGNMYSGKDHFAQYLKEQHGYYILSFSDQLKYIAKDLFPWLKSDYPSDKKNEQVFYNEERGVEYTPRLVWQALDILPQIDPAIFIRRLNIVLAYIESDANIIIKDVRRPAELKFIQEAKFTLIHLKINKTLQMEKSVGMDHISESFIKEISKHADYVFENDYSGIDKFAKFYKDNFINV